MMKNTLKYKGFTAQFEYDFEEDSISGEVPNIQTPIELDDIEEHTIECVEAAFHKMIDDYIARAKCYGLVTTNDDAEIVNIAISKAVWNKISGAVLGETHDVSLYDEVERIVVANQ